MYFVHKTIFVEYIHKLDYTSVISSIIRQEQWTSKSNGTAFTELNNKEENIEDYYFSGDQYN